MTISMAEKANAPSVGDNKACSNGGSGENKCGDDKGTRTEGGSAS